TPGFQNELSAGPWSRVKREWVIPAVNLPENLKGPYPKIVLKIKSNNQNKVAVTYKISGPGADQAPEGLFIIDQHSGVLYVTQPLDREKAATYSLRAHAMNERRNVEDPIELLINVIDQNDNAPTFTHSRFYGGVSESAEIGDSVIKVTAVDQDDPHTTNAIIRYRITAQRPQTSGGMFDIDPVSGRIGVKAPGLDRETQPEYKLVVEAADLEGEGLTSTCTAVITVIDSNDNAPLFSNTFSFASVLENVVGAEVIRLQVSDKDDSGSPNANTKYSLIKGNEGGEFSISRAANKMDAILRTAKALDFEGRSGFTLMVVATNEVPFTGPVTTSTATITVEVLDQNEPPVFSPVELRVSITENANVGSSVADLRAEDPDTTQKQSVRYKLHNDSVGWLSIDKDSGSVKVKSSMDRESRYVTDGNYNILVLAYDDDIVPATGTGTLLVSLLDENDNGPVIKQRTASLCSRRPAPVQLDVMDPDGPGHAGPFTLELLGEHEINWTISANSTTHLATLAPTRELSPGRYKVLLRLYDAGWLFQDSTLDVEVCPCQGAVSTCSISYSAAPRLSAPSVLTSTLGAVFCLLLLILLLLLLLRRRRRRSEKEATLFEELPRENIFIYNEEGGGEEDREFDWTLLSRGPGSCAEVTCTQGLPPDRSHPGCQHLRAHEDISRFLKDKLQAAGGGVPAPPHRSPLVLDRQGAGSQASSLFTDPDEEQNFQRLDGWGPGSCNRVELCADRTDE
uniref:Cadherin-1 n=1 Tax=Tetraodon nigroviridis TaxID=99883 RepID=H3DKS3_TETNG